MEDIRNCSEFYTINTIHNNENVITTIKHDKKFELWIISHTSKHAVIDTFLDVVEAYATTLIIFLIVLFLLFKYIANAEERKRQELLYQANHDTLTGLPNRNYMVNNIHKWINKKK